MTYLGIATILSLSPRILNCGSNFKCSADHSLKYLTIFDFSSVTEGREQVKWSVVKSDGTNNNF